MIRQRGPGFLSVIGILTLLCIPAAASSAPQRGTSVRGEVTAVYDGDTIKVLLRSQIEKKVRLIGVDSPELGDSREAVRFLAHTAKRYAFRRLYKKTVELSFGPELEDAYGRLLAFLWLEDGTLFNETIIREGYAFAYLKFPFDDHLMKTFKQAERRARADGRGLWQREPYPLIEPGEAGQWEERIVTVRFLCESEFDRGRFRILTAASGAFEAVIPRGVLPVLPGPESYVNLVLSVTGLVERYRGRPQIMINVPGQIEISGDLFIGPPGCCPGRLSR